MMKKCVMEDKTCINCGECNRCDLDKEKICNNCERCINMPEGEYYEIIIDEVMNQNEQ